MRNPFNNVVVIFIFMVLLSVGAASVQSAPVQAQQPIAAVNAFVKAIPSKFRKQLLYPLNHEERFNFGWVPGTRDGVSLKELHAEQRKLLFDVLQTVLSEKGIKKVKNIIRAEAALAEIEDAPEYRNPYKYWLTIFGNPKPEKKWGLRFEGHHLSLNITLKGNEIISAMPSFVGTNPSKITAGPHKGLRPMARDMDAAWAFYKSLRPEQRQRARDGGSLLGGLKSSAGTKKYDIGYPDGLPTIDMTEKQSKLLMDIIVAFVEIMPASYRGAYLKTLRRREFDTIRFHWSGSEQPGDSYLYRIHGRRLLIEHDAHDDSGHIHSIWRDKGFDFGISTRWTPWDHSLREKLKSNR